MNEEDKSLLKYAGWLGHTVVVIEGKKNNRRVRIQCNTVEEARTFAAEFRDSPLIYQKKGKKWIGVAPTAQSN